MNSRVFSTFYHLTWSIIIIWCILYIYIHTYIYIFNITLVDLILLLLILYSYTAKSYQIKGQKTAQWSGSWSFRSFTKRHRRGGQRVVTGARGAVVGTTGGFTVVWWGEMPWPWPLRHVLFNGIAMCLGDLDTISQNLKSLEVSYWMGFWKVVQRGNGWQPVIDPSNP